MDIFWTQPPLQNAVERICGKETTIKQNIKIPRFTKHFSHLIQKGWDEDGWNVKPCLVQSWPFAQLLGDLH